MPKVSINILTKDRAEFLHKALASVLSQTFKDFEIVVVDDGSADNTEDVLNNLKAESLKNLRVIIHQTSVGITASRQEALEKSAGEYVAVLDDDDEWISPDKLKKQVEFLGTHPDCVIVGGGIRISNTQNPISKFRAETDRQIKRTMLLRNNFFTSTVMFKKDAAISAGGFIKDGVDLGEDYDLWLRMGKLGQMYNFPEEFTAYRQPHYNKEKFRQFITKQLRLVSRHRADYPYASFAAVFLKLRLLLGI
jgi:glycosyltransferase involved in cell wall biosynthesis